jgi:serine protease Do
MQKSTKRVLSFSALILGAVIFGMVVAGSVHLTPQSQAQKSDASSSATAPARTRGAGQVLPSFADIAEDVMPSVVSITSTEIVKAGDGRRRAPGGSDGDPFEFFFGPQGPNNPHRRPQQDEDRKQAEGGTGFVISEDGYVVTNYHVIENADKIEVRLSNNETAKAKLVGKDPATDLALLKIDVKQRLKPLELGDSDKLRVGEWVMAIGDPISFDKTVTVGVVSGKNRSNITADPTTRSFENFIQTDAAINFGNSGGPLLDVYGRVIGINTAMFRPAQNIGFAVPVNTLKQVLPQLRDKGKVVRGYLGINIANVTSDVAAAFNLKSTDGAFVQSTLEGKPGEKAGLKPGDTIIRVDGVPVKETRDLIGYVSAKPPGGKVKLDLVRDGREMTVTASLADRDAESGVEEEKVTKSSDDSKGKIGVSVQEITPQVRQLGRLEPETKGLLVAHVKEVSPAFDAGIRDNDIITQVNGRTVTSTEEFGKIVSAAKKGEYLKMYILRLQPKASFFALVKIED